MTDNLAEIEKRLWEAADQLRANSGLKASEYSVPVLGLVFLRYANYKFAETAKVMGAAGSGRRIPGRTDYQARGVLFIPEISRFERLLALTEGANVGKEINEAMKGIEDENDELKGVLPKTYTKLSNDTLITLLKAMNAIPMNIEGDAFGKIYEYFLGKFAMSEGAKGGEFFTPTALVKLIVEIIEPFHGRIYDPACGSGGMFIQSARFVENHKRSPGTEISVFGQEKTIETVRLCKMNLAVHGLSGDIREANSYYEDLHKSPARFDFVMANPPFNVNGVDKDRIRGDDKHFPFGCPSPDNGNYLWMQLFYSSLNSKGRAGFVMANSACDARGSEQEIRKKLIQSNAVDVMVNIGPNFFYTVTLPCTLWFLDKGKKGNKRERKVLFIDAREIYRQLDRAHRDFAPEQIEFIANIVRLYRGDKPEYVVGSESLTTSSFPDSHYIDIPGLCKVADIEEIESHGWSLNPGRYIAIADQPSDEFDFLDNLEQLAEEFQSLTARSRQLEESIADAMLDLLQERV